MSRSKHVDPRATPRQYARRLPQILAARRLRREVSDLPRTDKATVDPGLDPALLCMAAASRALDTVKRAFILELASKGLPPGLATKDAAGSSRIPS